MAKYSISDKLAFALACLAAVMALMLFWVDRTPWTAGICLFAMAGLLIYPVLHFVPNSVARIVIFVILAIGLVVFGWNIWPGRQVRAVAAQSSTPVTSPTQSNMPTASGNGSVAIGGGVVQRSQGDCSPNIIGGKTVINCGPIQLKKLKPGNLPDPPLSADMKAMLQRWDGPVQTLLNNPSALKVYIGDSLAVTTKENQSILDIAGKNVLSFHRSPDGIAIDAKVFDSDGKIVVGIENNVARPNSNNVYYIESPDHHTLIVHDQHDETVLNIKYINSHSVRVTGVFRYGGSGPVDITDDGITANDGKWKMSGNLYGDSGGSLLSITPPPQ